MDFFLGITNLCNLECELCAHRRLREVQPTYVMQPREFEKWYRYTDAAGYRFSAVDFNGLGEPTLYPDIDFFKYMLIRVRRFTPQVNILTNGTRPEVLEKLLPFVSNITISKWQDYSQYHQGIDWLASVHPHKVHVREHIPCHDMREEVSEPTPGEICGCSGPGYTMGTVFLNCGTWCPSISCDGIHHSLLTENYLGDIMTTGLAIYGMCQRCWANTSVPYKEILK